MNNTKETEMKSQIRRMSDARLDKELAFAEGFGTEIAPNAYEWLAELRAESQRRKDA